MTYPQTSFQDFTFAEDSFWSKKRKTISSVALFYQLDVLKETGRYDAFKLKWHPTYDEAPETWPVPNHLFWDSDVAKWIEGACYFLAREENSVLQEAVDELVAMIASAQQPDGYLNIHFTVVEPSKRFTNLRDLHELYNAGHLIEAALAHHKTFKNNDLLDPMLKYVSLLSKVFGSGQQQTHGYPGHPEIELALLRLYSVTNDITHLELAHYFLTERGNPTGCEGRHFYDVEAEARGDGPHVVPDYYPEPRAYWYQQAHLPLLEQKSIKGHSVRAMYLLTALADLQRIETTSLDPGYLSALKCLWTDMVERKMYLTGGVGAMEQWEGFGQDYFLPHGSDEGGCYAETCAAIGVVMFAERLAQLELDAKYVDVLELALYNGVLTGVACNGREFTYVNQLASTDQDLSQREKWFSCACCPPNVVRLLGSLGGYFCSTSTGESGTPYVNVHMFSGGEFKRKIGDENIQLSMKTNWPLEGNVQFEVSAEQDLELGARIRIPSWAGNNWEITPAPEKKDVRAGYLYLEPTFIQKHPNFHLSFKLQPRLISPHPLTGHKVVAVARGPLVYCAEDVDNTWVEDHFKCMTISPNCVLTEHTVHDDQTKESYVEVEMKTDLRRVDIGNFTGISSPSIDYETLQHMTHNQGDKLVLIPYYFRANRGGRGHMRVAFQI